MDICTDHAHLFPRQIREDGSRDVFLKTLDDCGIAKAVVFAPFRSQVEKAGIDANAWLRGEVKDHLDRLIPYGCINPVWPDAADEVRRCKDFGFRGVKIHPAFDKFNILDPRAMPFYAACEQCEMVVDIHTGIHWHRLEDYRPIKFDDVAIRFPKLHLVFEHVGGRAFFQECLAVIINNQHNKHGRHLWAGLTSVLQRDVQKYWYLGPEGIRELIWQIGDNELLYGLDFPYNNTPLIQDDLRQIRDMDIPAATKEKILGGNLKRLLKL